MTPDAEEERENSEPPGRPPGASDVADSDEAGQAGSGDDSTAPDSRTAIMRATYRALCEHGYADLTMQDIADEAPVSKAALHYHYDSKRALLAAFQAYISDRFLARVQAADDPAADPRDRLGAVLDAALSPPEDDDLTDLQTALLELKAQSPYEPDFREHNERTDRGFRDLVAEILAAGVAAGVFQADLDPADTAQFVATVIVGNQARQVSVGQSPAETRRLLRTHVEETIAVDDPGDGDAASGDDGDADSDDSGDADPGDGGDTRRDEEGDG